MIPEAFDYVRASSVHEAIDMLGRLPAAVPMAGGQSLLPDLKLTRRAVGTVVDISGLEGLRHITADRAVLRMGAGVRLAEIERSSVVRRHLPVLAHSAASVADRQVRARATVGGSLADANAAADLPATLLALDAVYVVEGPAGRRSLPAVELARGPRRTSLASEELLVEVRIPYVSDLRWSYQKFRQRSHEWATVGVVAVEGAGTTRIGLMAMGATTMRAEAPERLLADGASPREAAAVAAVGTSPPADARADAEYRRHLVEVLTERALHELAAQGHRLPVVPGDHDTSRSVR